MVDPYDWLEIPATSRPPSHYDLLGLNDAVNDAAAIRSAADRQIRRLSPHLTGSDALEAERVWAEVEEARDTLLDLNRRSQYDAREIEAAPPPSEEAESPVSAEELQDATLPEPEPWWKTHPPAAPAVAKNDWWQQPLPTDAPTPVLTGPAWLATLPPIDTKPIPPAPPPPSKFVPTKLPDLPHLTRALPRTKSKLPLLLGGLVVASLIGTGVFFAVNRFSEPTTPTPAVVDKGVTTKEPTVNPVVAPTVEEHVETPLPKDFADQLRPRIFVGHAGAVNSLAVSATGTRFASVGNDKTVRLWSLTRDESTIRQTLIAPGVGVAWVDNDRTLAAVDGLNLSLLPAMSMKPPKTLGSPRGGVTAFAITADGSKAATGIKEGYLRLWDTAAGRFDEWALAANGSVNAIDISSQDLIAAAVYEGPISLWNLATRDRVHEWSPHAGGASALDFSPDGSKLATGGADGMGAIFDIATKKEICRLEGHTGPIMGIAWLPDGRQVATVSIDGSARIWSAETGKPTPWLRSLAGKGYSVAIDPEGRYLLAGLSSGAIELFPLPRVKPDTATVDLETPPASPLPVPDDLAGEVAAVQRDFARDYAFARPDDRAQLADNLRFRGLAKGIPPARRYALLEEARMLAAQAGDGFTAFRVIDEMCRWFDRDELATKAQTFAALPKEADAVILLKLGFETAERAEIDARPEIAERLVALMPKDDSPRSLNLRSRTTASAAERKTVRAAMTLLKNAPNDPGANLTFGRYLTLARQDWAAGLQYLARGNDVKLQDAAKLDLLGASEPKAQHRLGETWYALALEAKDQRSKRALLGRARTWFERE